MPIHTVVLTRFNMSFPAFHRAGHRIAETAMQQWLANRIAIFERVCFPSMTAQTRLPDIWMIGFDALYRDAVAGVMEIIRPYPWIVPVWQEIENGVHVDAYRSFKQAIGNTFPPHGERLLTIRIDNDDAMSLSYCEAVHDLAASTIRDDAEKKDFWISFPFGLQVCNGTCKAMTLENNAFLARCTAVDAGTAQWHTALDGNHMDVFRRGEVVLSPIRQAMWLEYVHGTNLLNAERKKLPAVGDVRAELARFGLGMDVLDFRPPHIDRASLFEPRPGHAQATGKAATPAGRIRALIGKAFFPGLD